MPKYVGKQNVRFMSFPKWLKSNEHRRRRERERKKVSVNNGHTINASTKRQIKTITRNLLFPF